MKNQGPVQIMMYQYLNSNKKEKDKISIFKC